MTVRRAFLLLVLLAAGLCAFGSGKVWAARDASFLAPSAATNNTGIRLCDGAIGIEPKSEIDLGETGLNVGKRTTLFFVNQTNLPVEIVGVSANGDTSVSAEIVADDCSKQGAIAASSRCSVTVEVTPKSPGPWTAEVLMTHNGAGRLARAKLSGKTSGTGEKKETGLSLSTKDVKPVDFGSLELGTGKAVRTALMVNDSNEAIAILSIEVIAPENGLQKLDQGCAPDMDLRPGESCPVTLLWKPEEVGAISTDLIIRHTGRQGFSVVPIRGLAKPPKEDEGGKKAAAPPPASKDHVTGVPLSPTAEEMEKMLANKVEPVSSEAVENDKADKGKKKKRKDSGDESAASELHLIGTVGSRGVFYKGDGSTVVMGVGESVDLGDEEKAKIIAVTSRQAEVMIGGRSKILNLETVAALTEKAAKAKKEKSSSSSSSSKKGESSSSSSSKGKP